MFTGIVQAVGQIESRHSRGGDVRIVIGTPSGYLTGTAVGDSIAVSGCCLTVVDQDTTSFTADVSRETLSLTTVDAWQPGTAVNLEKALRAGDPLGGHYVTGHVDGVATIAQVTEDARSRRVRIDVPANLARYIARKGSVTVDGVSLTVNAVDASIHAFEINLVPHTLAVTTLGGIAAGTRVNLEVDIVARYMERLLSTPAGDIIQPGSAEI